MSLDSITIQGINPALAMLPTKMDSAAARRMLLAIGLQESRFVYRRQVGGPARSFWQAEEGGGVKQACTHHTTAAIMRDVCAARDVRFAVRDVYLAIENDDILAAAVARLILWTDPKSLPPVDAPHDDSWACYIRNWHPGKPHRDTWDAFDARAVQFVKGNSDAG